MPKRSLLVLLALVLAGCTGALPDEAVGPFKTDPTVTASVTGSGADITVQIHTSNFKVIPAASATDKHKYGEGHFHLFLDVNPTAPGEVIPNSPGIYHTADTSYTIHNVTKGHHVLWVVLGFSDHTPYQQIKVSGATARGTATRVEFDSSNGSIAVASPSPVASAAASPSASVAPSSPLGPAAAKVSLLTDATNGGKYQPPSVTVKVGSTVEWDWNDSSASHSVTDDAGAFDSGVQSQGYTFTFTYKTAGTFGYSCTVHPNMKGTVVVQ